MDLNSLGNEGVSNENVYARGLKTMIKLGAPSDYGAYKGEWRFRIDNYFPSKTPQARREGETDDDVSRRLQELHA